MFADFNGFNGFRKKQSRRTGRAVRVAQRQRPLFAILGLIAAFLIVDGKSVAQLPSSLAQAAAPTQPAPAATVEASPQAADLAIPLPQVADQAEDLDQKLAEISSSLAARRDAMAPDQAVISQTAEIKERAAHVASFLESLPDILQLRDEMVYWKALSYQSAQQRKLLTLWAAELQEYIGVLDEEQVRWRATRDQIQDTAGIEVVAARVQQEVDAIRTLRTQSQEQLNQVLTLQNGLSQTSREISDSLAKLNAAEGHFRGSLLDRDSSPLWAHRAHGSADRPMKALLRGSAAQDFEATAEFLRTGAAGLLSIPVVYILGLLGAFRLQRYLHGERGRGVAEHVRQVLARPYALACLATLIVAVLQIGSAPAIITLVFYLVWLWVVFLLAPHLVKPDLRRLLYPLLALNLLELLRVGIPLPSLANRIFLFVVIVAALAIFGWLARPSRLRQLHLSKWAMLVLQAGTGVGMMLMVIALIANIAGFVALSHVLGVGTLLSAFFATALYCAVRVLLLLLSLFLDAKWGTPFSPELRQSLENWSRRGLVFIAVLLWWTRSELYVFLIHDSLAGTVSSILGYSLSLGKVELTIGTMFSVLLILGGGYALARGFTSLLTSVLTARLPLRRGLPYAISKVTYYILLLLVFFAALSRGGVELNKFTVITGALGVGVGFGLQNIVNNFASGLILLFERPIRVGDTVEVSNLIGTVKRIGARSSTITTGQGAEVIVPNSNLLSNYVINWTLSSPIRRVDIQVGVAYGSDPDAVLKLLAGVAAAHPEVMRDPAPVAFFLGFGDSALNFELRFWAGSHDTWFQLKSDVTTGVASALREAKIEIPFPQRDLHIKTTDLTTAERAGLLIGVPASRAVPLPTNSDSSAS